MAKQNHFQKIGGDREKTWYKDIKKVKKQTRSSKTNYPSLSCNLFFYMNFKWSHAKFTEMVFKGIKIKYFLWKEHFIW